MLEVYEYGQLRYFMISCGERRLMTPSPSEKRGGGKWEFVRYTESMGRELRVGDERVDISWVCEYIMQSVSEWQI